MLTRGRRILIDALTKSPQDSTELLLVKWSSQTRSSDAAQDAGGMTLRLLLAGASLDFEPDDEFPTAEDIIRGGAITRTMRGSLP